MVRKVERAFISQPFIFFATLSQLPRNYDLYTCGRMLKHIGVEVPPETARPVFDFNADVSYY
jgi:hypothetical protein